MAGLVRSAANPLVKELARLRRGAERRSRARFLCEGRRCLDGLLAAGWRPHHLLVAENEPVPSHWPAGPLLRVSAGVAAKLSATRCPSGYLGCFPIPVSSPVVGGDPTLVLVGIADPGNVGTLIRSAAAFGFAQVVLAGGADPYQAKAIQASAGAIARVRLHRQSDALSPAELPRDLPWIALDPHAGDGPTDLPAPPWWLLVGSEAHGLDAAWTASGDRRLRLPMREGLESLNAGVAGSIAAYLAWTAPPSDSTESRVRTQA